MAKNSKSLKKVFTRSAKNLTVKPAQQTSYQTKQTHKDGTRGGTGAKAK